MDNNEKNETEFSYASAPYNFIPFPDKVVYRHTIEKKCIDENKGINMLPTHDEFRKDLKTGYIDYSIEVKTPLFISNGNDGFFKISNEYTLSGSTVRGKIRNNCEILSCSYPDFIENKKLWYRGAFAKDILKDMYKEQVLSGEKGEINEKVQAGYLTREGDRWFITPAMRNNNKSFRKVHESVLRNRYKSIDKEIANNIFMYNRFDLKKENSSKLLWDIFYELKNKKKEIYKKIKEKKLSDNEIKNSNNNILKINNEIKNLLKNNKIAQFKPYYYRVLYDFDEQNDNLDIKKITKSKENDDYGFLMNSSRLNLKQNHYLILKKDEEKYKTELSKELISQYKVSVKCRQNEEVESFKLDKDIDFKEGQEKPVFYFTDENHNIISFGFTPYLKVPYKKSVHDGIKTKGENIEALKQGKVDYSKSIFGFNNLNYNNETISYKGRLSFTNAKCIESFDQIEKPILKYLMNPKISSFQLYLKQYDNDLKKLKTYSSDEFELRGQKFYWLRNKCNKIDDYEKDKQYCEKLGKEPNRKQYAALYPVVEGTIFKGRIYFENLYEDELGLLLMSIKPFKYANENLGQGKPYGYGKVIFEVKDIMEINNEHRFKSIDSILSEKSIMKDKNSYIDKFKSYMMKQNINVDFNNEFMYKCFKESKIKTQKIFNRQFNYMKIKDFKNRKVLKSMNEIIKTQNVKEYVAVDKEIEK